MIGQLPNLASAADINHRYSVGADYGYSFRYTGVLVVRQNVAITTTPGPSCNVPYATPVAYETQWVVMNSTATDWVELGTGYQCNGFKYYYWGYGSSGNWFSYGTDTNVPTGVSRYMDIHRLSEGGVASWHYLIQGVERFKLGWAIAGYFVEAGLETYDSGAVAPSMLYDQLQETFDEGPWNWWTLNYRRQLVTDALMCGHFNSQTQWVGSENSPC
jgi:hypothetical protein